MSELLFTLIIWIPLIVLIVSVVLVCVGWYLKYSKRPGEKMFLGATFALMIPVAFYMMFFIIDMISFWLGRLD